MVPTEQPSSALAEVAVLGCEGNRWGFRATCFAEGLREPGPWRAVGRGMVAGARRALSSELRVFLLVLLAQLC